MLRALVLLLTATLAASPVIVPAVVLPAVVLPAGASSVLADLAPPPVEETPSPDEDSSSSDKRDQLELWGSAAIAAVAAVWVVLAIRRYRQTYGAKRD